MALIITGIFIQFLGLAVQVIQLRRRRLDNPGPRARLVDGGLGGLHRTAAQRAVGDRDRDDDPPDETQTGVGNGMAEREADASMEPR